jgi:Tol biopolymer transport system component
VSEIKQHKAGAVVVLGLFAIVVAGITFGLYKLFGKDKAGVRAQPIKISRLTTNAKAKDAAISFDGKFVVYVMDDGGQQSLWVKQVITGSNVQIVPPANVAYSGLTFSKAADYVYYVKHENKDIGTLYRMPVLGGASKKLIDRVNSAITLSPDGNQMAFLRANHPNLGDTLLMVANADGGGERVLASRKRPELFPWYEGQAPSWSPDGKKIACIVEGGYEGSFVNLIEVRLEDVEEKRITSRGWYDIQRVAWLSDGSGLMISGADQASAFFAAQIWRVSYPSGEAQRITADLNNYAGLSLTANSDSLVAVQLSRLADIWVAPSGEVNRATQITAGGNNYEGGGMPSNVWTLDGRIAYYSRASGAEDIWIMDWEGSNQKQLTVDSGPNYSPTVSGDGRYIVFVSERAGRQNIWRMDIDGSNPKQLTNGTGETLPSCSPDGRWVLYTSSSSGKPTVWRIAIDGLGEPSQLINQASEQSVISPDGKSIACRYRDDPNSPWRMAILPFEGGKPKTILDLPVSSNLYYRWTLDGRSLAYIDTRDGVSNIWSLPVDGGPPKQVTDFTHDRIFFFDWSRDGKHLLLGRGTETSDVILIRNF